jgi:hypothetical protein
MAKKMRAVQVAKPKGMFEITEKTESGNLNSGKLAAEESRRMNYGRLRCFSFMSQGP